MGHLTILLVENIVLERERDILAKMGGWLREICVCVCCRVYVCTKPPPRPFLVSYYHHHYYY